VCLDNTLMSLDFLIKKKFFFFFSRRAKRMGQHCWLLLATIMTEILVITKWSKGMFAEPLPVPVQWGWIAGALVLVLYPVKAVSSVFFFFLMRSLGGFNFFGGIGVLFLFFFSLEYRVCGDMCERDGLIRIDDVGLSF